MEKSNKGLIAIIIILIIALIFSFGYIVQTKKLADEKSKCSTTRVYDEPEIKKITINEDKNILTTINSDSLKGSLNNYMYQKGHVYTPNLSKLEMTETFYYAYDNNDESIRYYKINGIYQCFNPANNCFFQEPINMTNIDGSINYTKYLTIKKENENEYYLKEVSDTQPNIENITEVNEAIS